MRGMILLAAILSLSVLVLSATSRAEWIKDDISVYQSPSAQPEFYVPSIASDGAGGAIIAWQGHMGVIYCRRITALGDLMSQTALCAAMSAQTKPVIISDGVGGAIVAWEDSRNGDSDIYAQRVNASGSPLWTTNGIAVCIASQYQTQPRIAPSSETGGALIVWQDLRNGNMDVYAQRIQPSSSGSWGVNGAAICTAAGSQGVPQVVSDGALGAIITWEDARSGTYDIYANRINESGLKQWGTNGTAICSATGDQRNPRMIDDGSKGAIITWVDNRSGTNDVFAARIDNSASILWTSNGAPVCTASGSQSSVQITPDGSGGAVIAWDDERAASGIYAQKVAANGFRQWGALDGVAISSGGLSESNPQLVSDGAGGAVVVWQSSRNTALYADVYAQRINSSGTVLWTTDGIALCTAAREQVELQIASDGIGGAILAWEDWRNWRTGYECVSVYSQRIERNGYWGYPAPSIYAVRDVPGDQGGFLNLSWDASRLDPYPDQAIDYYSIWKAIDPTAALLRMSEGMTVLKSASDYDRAAGLEGAVRLGQLNGQAYYWELVGTQTANSYEHYSKKIATDFDSSATCTEWHYFQVCAHAIANPRICWTSPSDSGRSVDNLAPGSPTSLAGQQEYTPAGLNLTWRPNVEADIAHYAVYRGTSAGFVPGVGNVIATPKDTTLLDNGWRWSSGYYYKVSAIDIHGNESGFALLTPNDVTGSETPKAPAASYLAQNYPNPFNPTTRIAFGLSAPGHVSLRIYDAAGRLVRMLAEKTRPAANYVEVWDGKDASGRAVASGIYFCRLDAGSFTQTRKLILLR